VFLETAISRSSDVYFYIMGFRFWEDGYKKDNLKVGYAIQKVAKLFGFGQRTNIGLADEHAGRIPDQKFKAELNEDSPNESDRSWLPGDSAALSIGQGDLLVTPLQLASAYAAFANGGTIHAPRLASAIITPDGQSLLRKLPAQEVDKVPLDLEARSIIMTGLKNAVIGLGTAGPAFLGYDGAPIAGKTGTGEVLGKQDTSVFVGIVNPDPPADAPDSSNMTVPQLVAAGRQYVVVVFVEEGGNGGSVAAPIAKRIILGLNGVLNPPEVRLVPPKEPGGDL
jgi:penicillin-binding protein 2